MNRKELAIFLGITEGTLAKNFVRTQETFRKRGIELVKEGRGRQATYSWREIRKNAMIEYLREKKDNSGKKC